MPTGLCFVFEPYELDPARRRLSASGEPVTVSDRQLDVLLLLVARAGQIVTKDDLLEAGWKDVAVGDNSVEQAISNLRRLLGVHPSGGAYIETVPRRGYRFGVAVVRRTARESDAGLEALLAPHRAFIEGRAALDTLDGGQIAGARTVFEGALRSLPEHASAHVGLANACILQFEMTRADPVPDTDALALAVAHAREACRLDPEYGEAWATLGFVLDRTDDRRDALAASKRAVTLEPDNWRHHVRMASVGWGDDRLRAAGRTLALLPHFPPAHWLAATVFVARGAFEEAERELMTALAAPAGETKGQPRFSSMGLHWLLGLLHLARGNVERALEEFKFELALERGGHLYARECCANTWYAIGALRMRQGQGAHAATAFAHALERVAGHPMALVGLAALGLRDRGGGAVPSGGPRTDQSLSDPLSVEAAMVRAAQRAVTGELADAANLVGDALAIAAPGNAGWLLPVEPLLQATAHPDLWARPLALVRARAA